MKIKRTKDIANKEADALTNCIRTMHSGTHHPWMQLTIYVRSTIFLSE